MLLLRVCNLPFAIYFRGIRVLNLIKLPEGDLSAVDDITCIISVVSIRESYI